MADNNDRPALWWQTTLFILFATLYTLFVCSVTMLIVVWVLDKLAR